MPSLLPDVPTLGSYAAQGRPSTAIPTSVEQGKLQSSSVPAGGGITISLSATGRSLSGSPARKNQDIDDSDLPAAIKETLKRIRELRMAMQEKIRELNEAMADRSLTDEQRRQRVEGLQVEVAALISALALANNALLKLLDDPGLGSDQKMTAGMLSLHTPQSSRS
jgi:hypothetical protein